ncbi:DEAD/DEAH box helicase [Clostridium butyricum]|uniref:DEAD/DEAH box helicase n=1 Tax=Clostridium butyricum TaxID=1492 RepID=A0AAP9UDC4_CLOBU|nr:DEAD/DEAH box helicase [Clostridium butyricum]MBZ5746259.1 DEAD/DEAH box helicase family protein [Clostridium butyricum]MDI9210075.1 DEAD/DEAH box helicase family protein [Clostridium butyricum]QMW90146.1 DEAD/DEAH box helicase [Clostridium butyricum]
MIVGGTGIGKSHYIINTLIKELVDEGEKVLLLANRSTLVEQHKVDVLKIKRPESEEEILEEVNRKLWIEFEGRVRIVTYHTLAESCTEYLHRYNHVICDEAHFIVQDALFNEKCDTVLEKLLELYSYGKNIIMTTATEFELIPHLWLYGVREENNNFRIFNYNDKHNWYDRIQLNFTSKRIADIARLVQEDAKCIIFTKKNKMKRMAEILGDADYIHSKWNNGAKDIEMEQKQIQLIKSHSFEEKHLITNSALDNGVSIKDKKVKTIIIDGVYDMVQIIQMIGRKRFDVDDEADKLQVYIITHHNEVKREYDKVLQELRMYTDYEIMLNKNTDEALIKFNDMYKEYFKVNHNKQPKLHVIGKDTDGITAKFFLRNSYLAKLGCQKDVLCKLNNIALNVNEFFTECQPIKNFININQNFANIFAEKYKHMSEVVIDKGVSKKYLEEKRTIQINRDLKLLDVLEEYSQKEFIALNELEAFKNRLKTEFGMGDKSRSKGISPSTINYEIKELGYYIDSRAKKINGKSHRVWIVNKVG